MVSFEYPWLAILGVVPLVLLVLFYALKRYRLQRGLIMPSAPALVDRPRRRGNALRSQLLLWLYCLSMLAFTLAAMNPYISREMTSYDTYGVDIVLCLDVSESMDNIDFRPNRLEGAKNAMRSLIIKRKGDRLGLIIFGSEAWVQAPQTLEYQALLDILDNTIVVNRQLRQRTAIGEAIAVAASRLIDSKAETRLIVLITDGEDTAPERMRPLAAMQAAKQLGIKIYSIGIGAATQGGPDFSLLKMISKGSGGEFFRARSNQQLLEMTRKIDSLEKSIVGQKKEYRNEFISERYYYTGSALLLAGLLLSMFWSRQPEGF